MNHHKLIPWILTATFLSTLMIGCGVPAATPTTAPTFTPMPATPTLIPTSAPTVPSESASPAGKIPLLYDDDGSRDGMAALLYLLGHPEYSIEAISIAYGEAHPDVYIQHVGRVLDRLGFRDIPLGAGPDAPLAQAVAFPDWLREMSNNFWGFPLPNAGKTYPVQNAPEMIVSTLNQSSEPVTIFLSGPFTNLALALRLDPGIKNHIAAVYFMGGAVHSAGNITNLIPDSTNHVAEWNIYADPQAAREVFEAGLQMYMVPLDATGGVILSPQDINPWHQGDDGANLVADLYEPMFKNYGFKTVEIFDLTAAVVMVKPELCKFQSLSLDVVTGAGNTAGQTAIMADRQPNMHVCLEPDVNGIKQELNQIFSKSQASTGTPSIAPLIGTWKGTVWNNGFEMQAVITIQPTCQLGGKCGQFSIPTVSCAGTFTWTGMEGDLYRFQAGDKTGQCGEGSDYLLPQADGSVMYISRGDYGETKGTLQKEP